VSDSNPNPNPLPKVSTGLKGLELSDSSVFAAAPRARLPFSMYRRTAWTSQGLRVTLTLTLTPTRTPLPKISTCLRLVDVSYSFVFAAAPRARLLFSIYRRTAWTNQGSRVIPTLTLTPTATPSLMLVIGLRLEGASNSLVFAAAPRARLFFSIYRRGLGLTRAWTNTNQRLRVTLTRLSGVGALWLCFTCLRWWGRLCRRRCAAGGCARAVLVWGGVSRGYTIIL